MKKILLFTCAIAILSNTGCIVVPRGGWGWHGRAQVVKPGPEVAVNAPTAVVAPPAAETIKQEAMITPNPAEDAP